MTEVRKEKRNLFAEKYRRINSKPKQFQRIKYFVYYKLLLNKKKKFHRNLSTLSSFKFPEKQEVCIKLGSLKIIFQVGCTLNNQGQKLFQLGCALNQDIYGSVEDIGNSLEYKMKTFKLSQIRL